MKVLELTDNEYFTLLALLELGFEYKRPTNQEDIDLMRKLDPSYFDDAVYE